MTRDDRTERPATAKDGGRSAADSDRQLEHLFEQIGIERAPVSLRRRLRRIPREEQVRESWWQRLLAPAPGPRWALAPAVAAALLAVGVVLMVPRQPSQQDVMQARQDLAVAFRYIEQAGLVTGKEIQSVLGEGLRHPVKDNLSEHIPFTEQFRKEEKS